LAEAYAPEVEPLARAFFEDFLNGARKDNFANQGRVLKFDFFSQMATDAWDLAEQIVK